MTTLIFTPDRNTPPKKDYTGAFKPMAEHYDRWSEDAVEIIPIDVSKPADKRYVELMAKAKEAADAAKKAGNTVTTVIFMCHGWSTGIQLGLSDKDKASVKKLRAFLDLFKGTYKRDFQLLLFCCSTGADDDKDSELGESVNTAPGTKYHFKEGETSFADTARDILCELGEVNCRVFAHTTAGHTTKNPDILIFDGMGSPIGGNGGLPIARRGTPTYKKLAAYLKADESHAFEVATQSIAETHAELQKA